MIYIFLADGFEEIEALTPADILRRADREVALVGVGGAIIRGSHGINVFTDIEDREIVLDENLEMIVLPGGMPGTLNLEKNNNVQRAIDYCVKNNILIGAICAAPTILGHKGILDGKRACCYAGCESQLGTAIYNPEDIICKDANIITSRGPGAAIQFALALAEKLTSRERREKLEDALLCAK